MPYEDQNIDTVASAENFEFKMITNSAENKIKMNTTKLIFTLPDQMHFGSIIFEKLKQVSVMRKYLSKEFEILMKKTNFDLGQHRM